MMVKYIRKDSSIWEYIKAKLCRYGMKIWCLANAKFKYVQKMELYYSASHEDIERAIDTRLSMG